ncbi:MAG: hypothetical protein Q4C43_07635 [Prevotella sp.]|nr:hypothetical protein [Prevotella sp.]
MKEYMGYFSQITWSAIFFMWLILSDHMSNETPITTTLLAIGFIIITISVIHKIRKRIAPDKMRIPLSDNNCSMIMFVLGLGLFLDTSRIEYAFLVIIVVATIALDVCRRYLKDNN